MSSFDLIQHITLSNGIELYHYPADFPISSFRVVYSVGSGHATPDNDLLPGEPHFLEHMLLQRSKRWPGAKELTTVLGMKGGDDNGITYPLHTAYTIDIPAGHALLGVEALVDRLYYPIFDQHDIERERGVVSNERGQHEQFFPGNSPSSKYFETEVMHDVFLTLDQRFGSPSDLAKHTPASLKETHQKLITTEGAIVISVGSHNVDDVKQLLEAIPKINAQQLTPHIARAYWVHPDFHVVQFENVSDPSYEVEWLRDEQPTREEMAGFRAVLQLMVNPVHGVLYNELRHEKGWAYHMDWNSELYPEQTRYGFYFPLNSMEEITYLRSVLFERIESALQNQELVEKEIERRISNLAYGYQTSIDIADSMMDDLRERGEVYSDEVWKQDLQRLLKPEYRKYLQEKFFTRESFGEIAFFPKAEE